MPRALAAVVRALMYDDLENSCLIISIYASNINSALNILTNFN